MKVPRIQVEHDHSKFKMLPYNRDINRRNVGNLIKLLKEKNQSHLFPIVVNKDFEVIDGQHRLIALEELNLPVFYIQDNNTGNKIKDIYRMNIAGKKHSLKDKLEMLYKLGDENIAKVYEVYHKFNGRFRLEVVCNILASWITSGSTIRKLDNGTFGLNNLRDGYELLKELDKTDLENRYISSTIFGCAMICRDYKVRPADLVRRLQQNAHRIKWVSSREHQVYEFKKAYNYKLHGKYRLY